jgi:hypothetical protein
MKKILLASLTSLSVLFGAASCTPTPTRDDINKTQEVGNTLAKNQPTPTDFEYSLERYNLIRRAYWVNGQKEKAKAVTRPSEVPMGYAVLFTESGSVIGQFTVDGKITSLNSYLTPSMLYGGSSFTDKELPDVDGSYGSNDADGVFFFTPQWQYIEWTGIYIYSDTPFKISSSVLEDY